MGASTEQVSSTFLRLRRAGGAASPDAAVLNCGGVDVECLPSVDKASVKLHGSVSKLDERVRDDRVSDIRVILASEVETILVPRF